jgi:hypothetical protein
MRRLRRLDVSRLVVLRAMAILIVVSSIAGATAVLAADGPSLYPPPPPESPVVGDATLDGRVNVGDAVAIMQYTILMREFDEDQLRAADTTGDGRVNVGDAVQVMQYTVDPYGLAGVLKKPLWEWDDDAGLWDPLGLNAG